MLVSVSSLPASMDAPNEDAFAVGERAAVVVDGVTERTETGCSHGTAWFARHLAAQVLSALDEHEPIEALRLGIEKVALSHTECDLTHEATPCGVIACVRLVGTDLEWAVLGDVTILFSGQDFLKVVTDSRVQEVAQEERAAARAIPHGHPDKEAALVTMKRAQLAARNKVGGYWVAAQDPSAAAQAVSGTVSLEDANRVLLLSDGATRLVDMFQDRTWEDLVKIAQEHGTAAITSQTRLMEKYDGSASKWPRSKIRDDATAIQLFW